MIGSSIQLGDSLTWKEYGCQYAGRVVGWDAPTVYKVERYHNGAVHLVPKGSITHVNGEEVFWIGGKMRTDTDDLKGQCPRCVHVKVCQYRKEYQNSLVNYDWIKVDSCEMFIACPWEEDER